MLASSPEALVMRALKIAGIAVGALVIAWAVAATYGIPVRGLIESHSSDALAKAGLRLAIGGDARFTVWPATGLTIERACRTPAAPMNS
jgi:AsmA protein